MEFRLVHCLKKMPKRRECDGRLMEFRLVRCLKKMSKRRECDGCLMGATKVSSMFTCGFHVLQFVCKSVITYFGTVCTPRTHRGVVTVGRSFIFVQYRRESPLCTESLYKIRLSGLRSGFPETSLQGSPLQNTTFGLAFGFSENLSLRKPLTKYDFRVSVRVFRKPLSKEAPYKMRLSG